MRTMTVLVVGCALGWFVHGAHVQRDAVATIEKMGGGVVYDWQLKNGVVNPGAAPWAPKWLDALPNLSIDY